MGGHQGRGQIRALQTCDLETHGNGHQPGLGASHSGAPGLDRAWGAEAVCPEEFGAEAVCPEELDEANAWVAG